MKEDPKKKRKGKPKLDPPNLKPYVLGAFGQIVSLEELPDDMLLEHSLRIGNFVLQHMDRIHQLLQMKEKVANKFLQAIMQRDINQQIAEGRFIVYNVLVPIRDEIKRRYPEEMKGLSNPEHFEKAFKDMQDNSEKQIKLGEEIKKKLRKNQKIDEDPSRN